MNKPFVSVIIPAFNEERYIRKALEALIVQSYPRELYEVIVVDNLSSDNTVEIAKKYADKVEIFAEKPVGKVRNYGASLSKGDILIFLDSDCVACSNWIENSVELLISNRNKAFGGGINLRDNPFFFEKYWLLDGKYGGLLPKELIGASIALWKSHFELVGGFSKLLTAGEDSQLHKDLLKAGVEVEMTRTISVVHLGNAITAMSFLKRQIWHSESYAIRMKEAIKEPVFVFLCSFIFLHLSILFDGQNFTLYICLLCILVLIRSLHRVRFSQNINNLKYLFPIMILDYIYFIGRALGLFKGLWKRIL